MPRQRLTARILIFLTVALVPLGIIGIVQNQRLSAEIETKADLSLLALTEQASFGERQAIQRALGGMKVVSELFLNLRERPQVCSSTLQRLQTARTGFLFVGFVDTNGVSACSTSETVLDFSQSANFADLMATPRQTIEYAQAGQVTGQSVMVINEPMYEDGDFLGYVAASIPLDRVAGQEDMASAERPINLITFNQRGDILTTGIDRDAAQELLPEQMELSELTFDEPTVLHGTSQSGEDLAYAAVPIVPGLAYALGTWSEMSAIASRDTSPFLARSLPFAMWLASLFVAWFAIDRFVVDRIKNLSAAMMRFAEDRTFPTPNPSHNISTELADLDHAFRSMAEVILRDEAQQEDRLREKSILLKEVHHRVKNNLQIVSSIMSMQIRKASEDETKQSLSQVQDRILGLSSVHQTLYEAEDLTKIDASRLIQRVVQQSVESSGPDEARVTFDLDLAPVIIPPDQAVPLTMFVSEAITHLMRSIDPEVPFMKISLKILEDEKAFLTVIGSRLPDEGAAHKAQAPTGLGPQLMRAIAMQLNGLLEASKDTDTETVKLTFTIEAFREGLAHDY